MNGWLILCLLICNYECDMYMKRHGQEALLQALAWAFPPWLAFRHCRYLSRKGRQAGLRMRAGRTRSCLLGGFAGAGVHHANGIFERLGCTERNLARSRNADLFARLRIAAFASRPVFHVDDAELVDACLVTRDDFALDGAQKSSQQFFCNFLLYS